MVGPTSLVGRSVSQSQGSNYLLIVHNEAECIGMKQGVASSASRDQDDHLYTPYIEGAEDQKY